MKNISFLILLICCCVTYAVSNTLGFYTGTASSYEAKCKICSQRVSIWENTSYDFTLCVATSDIILEDEIISIHDYGWVEGGAKLSYSLDLAVCLECEARYQDGFKQTLEIAAKKFISEKIAENKEKRDKNTVINKTDRLSTIKGQIESLDRQKAELEKTRKDAEEYLTNSPPKE